MSKRKFIFCGLLITVVLVAFGVFYMLSYVQTLRLMRVHVAQAVLRQANSQFVKSGVVEPNGTEKPFVFTNVVAVNGVSYQCAVGIVVSPFEDEGMLSMTTNGVFIWLDKQRGAMVIPVSGYLPHFFPGRF
jgi:hypothetical protein